MRAREPLGAQPFDEIERDHLDDHAAMKRRVGGDEDSRHPTATQLTLHRVAIAQCDRSSARTSFNIPSSVSAPRSVGDRGIRR